MGKVIDKHEIMAKISLNRRIEKDFKESGKNIELTQRVKPIFCVGLPPESLNDMTQYQLDSIVEKHHDYHMIIYSRNIGDEIKFEAFYEKSITDIEFNELKEYVLSELKRDK